ncbi:Lipopolysaccharide biosynthesis protein WzxC [subsurface metagenome]
MPENSKANLSFEIDSSLSRKVSKGIIWVTVGMICGGGLSFVSAIIVARLLVPSDFGLMAIAMAMISLSQQATTTGFQSALIQRQKKPEDFLNTAWTFELARYLVLFLIIFLTAPLFASFFKEPRTVAILRVISLSLVFQGLCNKEENLDFHKQFILEIVPLIANILVVIPLAFILRNVWALVWASLTSGVVACTTSYVMHPYRPRLEFGIKKAKELFNFGRWILGSSIIVMIREQGITMFVGKLLGISILGFYNRAGVFSKTLFQQIVRIVWKVGYPTYSQLQDDSIRFKQAYLKTLQLLTFIGIPMAGGLFVLSWDFTHLLLTDKWLPIVPLIQILCLQAMLGFVNTPAGILFQASGKPSIGTKISTLGVIILAILIYPLSSLWGVTGTVSSLFLSVLLPSPIVWFMAMKVAKCSFSEFIKPVLFPIINTALMATVIFAIKKYILIQIAFIEFFGLILIGMVIYFTLTFFLDSCFNYGIHKLVKERIAVLR